MTITITYDNGETVVITAETFVEACLITLAQMRDKPVPVPARCAWCEFGRTPGMNDGYCNNCQLGRDLRRIEARGMPNPVGGTDD